MVEFTDPGLSDGLGKASRDHLAVIFKAYASIPAPVRKVFFRKLCLIDVDSSMRDVQNTKVFSDSLCVNNADEMVTANNNELSSTVEEHAPKRTKTIIIIRHTCSWYNDDLHGANHV